MISLDHYIRRAWTESQLMTERTRLEVKIDEVKRVNNVSQPGINVAFQLVTMDDLEQRYNAVVYALWKLDSTKYPEGEPLPTGFTYIYR